MTLGENFSCSVLVPPDEGFCDHLAKGIRSVVLN